MIRRKIFSAKKYIIAKYLSNVLQENLIPESRWNHVNIVIKYRSKNLPSNCWRIIFRFSSIPYGPYRMVHTPYKIYSAALENNCLLWVFKYFKNIYVKEILKKEKTKESYLSWFLLFARQKLILFYPEK
jgi:hypothetical protein